MFFQEIDDKIWFMFLYNCGGHLKINITQEPQVDFYT